MAKNDSGYQEQFIDIFDYSCLRFYFFNLVFQTGVLSKSFSSSTIKSLVQSLINNLVKFKITDQKYLVSITCARPSARFIVDVEE